MSGRARVLSCLAQLRLNRDFRPVDFLAGLLAEAHRKISASPLTRHLGGKVRSCGSACTGSAADSGSPTGSPHARVICTDPVHARPSSVQTARWPAPWRARRSVRPNGPAHYVRPVVDLHDAQPPSHRNLRRAAPRKRRVPGRVRRGPPLIPHRQAYANKSRHIARGLSQTELASQCRSMKPSPPSHA